MGVERKLEVSLLAFKFPAGRVGGEKVVLVVTPGTSHEGLDSSARVLLTAVSALAQITFIPRGFENTGIISELYDINTA